jgi:hypothetical protein
VGQAGRRVAVTLARRPGLSATSSLKGMRRRSALGLVDRESGRQILHCCNVIRIAAADTERPRTVCGRFDRYGGHVLAPAGSLSALPSPTRYWNINQLAYHRVGRRSFGGRCAPTSSPQQLKEVIQVAHSHVGAVATPVIPTRREAHGSSCPRRVGRPWKMRAG